MTRRPLRLAIIAAAEELASEGVPDPRIDAEILAAHVAGVQRSRLGLVPLVDEEVLVRYRELVALRATRVPLQHILGSAPLGPIDVAVGPGVFTPRFETELLFAWAIAGLRRWDAAQAGDGATEGRRQPPARTHPVVLDLCTGSGALALAIAHERQDAEVHAVELDTAALAWARRNADSRARAGDTPIHLHQGDVTDWDLLARLEGRVDVIVANPPYVPDATRVDVEVRDHDPARAVFAGPDGLDVIRPMVANIARWLRIDGIVGVEHDATNGDATADLFRARRVFDDVSQESDLVGRPRFVVARRAATAAEAQWWR
ncbi:peptide chain release factor N(5)-glutamine methyltransferase [Tomitella fengzijianii]|uniref:Release factor glutamine methyltransferase n=1 Tax=Tomitella fengzijianii TaxID=2597660 RepID=A0A516X2I2_9ACTN|nr:peptide chain release factor N(5)-glutamine methyltransferase [Tomitella fengzijianii]QDQ97292.1 peptide chain release factor N(5)-glutamine methyltransferase [Tomitella fengzijianii]